MNTHDPMKEKSDEEQEEYYIFLELSSEEISKEYIIIYSEIITLQLA